MDDIAKFNIGRWRQLADANAVFTRPALQLDAASARERIDPVGRLGVVRDRSVLVLAGGGGQQSIAFALLGARVTVIDLSDAQLDRDRAAAEHHGVDISMIQLIEGDMRDLSALPAGAFDIVWQPYSLNFVPDATVVFDEVARVLRPGGVYHVQLATPYFVGLGMSAWNGEGYVLREPYVAGAEITTPDAPWAYDRTNTNVAPGREFRHTLAAIVNGLADRRFVITHLEEGLGAEADRAAVPGSWEHFASVAPPWLAIWTRYDAHGERR